MTPTPEPPTPSLAESVTVTGVLLQPGRTPLTAVVGASRSGATTKAQAAPGQELGTGEKKKAAEAQGSDLAQLLRLEDLTLEIGFQLIALVDEKQGGQLLNRVRSLRTGVVASKLKLSSNRSWLNSVPRMPSRFAFKNLPL